MKDEITALLKSELDRVYCDTCSYHKSREYCDDCHRKMMNWSASQSFCDRLANTIVEKLTSANGPIVTCPACNGTDIVIEEYHCVSCGSWFNPQYGTHLSNVRGK